MAPASEDTEDTASSDQASSLDLSSPSSHHFGQPVHGFQTHARRHSSPNLEPYPYSPATTYYSLSPSSSPIPRSRHGSISVSRTHSPSPFLSPHMQGSSYLHPARTPSPQILSPHPPASPHLFPHSSYGDFPPQPSQASISPQAPLSPLSPLASPRPAISPLPSDDLELPPAALPPPPRPQISPLPSPSACDAPLPLERRESHYDSALSPSPPGPPVGALHAPVPTRSYHQRFASAQF